MGIVVAGTLLLLPPPAAAAQVPRGEGFSLRLEAGRLVRRDDRASPGVYTGLTWRGGASWVRPGRNRLRLALSGGWGHLTAPWSRDSRPRESVSEGRLRASMVSRLLKLGRAGGEVRAGVATSIEGWYSVHAYDDPNRTHHGFATGLLTLGPVVEVGGPAGPGAYRLAAAVPVVGVWSHPYSDVRVRDGWMPLETVSMGGGELWSAYGSAAYLWPAMWGAYGLAYGVELRAEPAPDHVRQSISLQATFGR